MSKRKHPKDKSTIEDQERVRNFIHRTSPSTRKSCIDVRGHLGSEAWVLENNTNTGHKVHKIKEKTEKVHH